MEDPTPQFADRREEVPGVPAAGEEPTDQVLQLDEIAAQAELAVESVITGRTDSINRAVNEVLEEMNGGEERVAYTELEAVIRAAEGIYGRILEAIPHLAALVLEKVIPNPKLWMQDDRDRFLAFTADPKTGRWYLNGLLEEEYASVNPLLMEELRRQVRRVIEKWPTQKPLLLKMRKGLDEETEETQEVKRSANQASLPLNLDPSEAALEGMARDMLGKKITKPNFNKLSEAEVEGALRRNEGLVNAAKAEIQKRRTELMIQMSKVLEREWEEVKGERLPAIQMQSMHLAVEVLLAENNWEAKSSDIDKIVRAYMAEKQPAATRVPRKRR